MKTFLVKMYTFLCYHTLLTKMWIGLYLSLVQVVFYIIVVINHDSKYWLEHSSVACVLKNQQFYQYSPNLHARISD